MIFADGQARFLKGEYIRIYFEPQLLERFEGQFNLLSDIRFQDSVTLRERNFIKNEIQNYSKLFDKLEQFPLSDEQKRPQSMKTEIC